MNSKNKVSPYRRFVLCLVPKVQATNILINSSDRRMSQYVVFCSHEHAYDKHSMCWVWFLQNYCNSTPSHFSIAIETHSLKPVMITQTLHALEIQGTLSVFQLGAYPGVLSVSWGRTKHSDSKLRDFSESSLCQDTGGCRGRKCISNFVQKIESTPKHFISWTKRL